MLGHFQRLGANGRCAIVCVRADQKCVCTHLQRGDASCPGRPPRRKRGANTRHVCVSANAERSHRASARFPHGPAWQRPWFDRPRKHTASARMSAGVATASINPPTAGMERRTAAEEQPPASSLYAPPLIPAEYNPYVYCNSRRTASFFFFSNTGTP